MITQLLIPCCLDRLTAIAQVILEVW